MQSNVDPDVGVVGIGSEAETRVLQPLWDFILRGHGGDLLASPVAPALGGLLIHLLLCAPFFALDALGCVSSRVRAYKISENANEPQVLRQWSDTLRRVCVNYVAVVLPVTAALQHLRRRDGGALPDLAPTCWQLCVQVVLCLLLFDTLFYVWHYAMHSAPELLSLLLLAMGTSWLLGCHPLSETVFHLLNSWLAVEDHCGYDLIFGLHRLLPWLGGGTPHHQLHHSLQKGNYAPYFTHWDRLWGTDIPSQC
ncbi:hypothetical protein CRUP_009220 [Coryphaenoides rupestris]|nr:hypothetical protein CRUP_009220 [Coryphaenoides rupestris]